MRKKGDCSFFFLHFPLCFFFEKMRKNYAILTNLTSNFDFLLQLSPQFIPNLAIYFKLIIALLISFNLIQIKSN
jgi:hypothetical protein